MTMAPLKITEMVRKVNVDTPAANGQDTIVMGNTLRFHIPYVGGNAILNPLSLCIRGQFVIENNNTDDAPAPEGECFDAFFRDNGIHCLFSTMRVMHGDRVIELIERYDDFAELYLSLHSGGKWGAGLRSNAEFLELGNYSSPVAGTTLLPQNNFSSIGPITPHEFCFQPLSAILGLRSVQAKFPLCVLNPMEPLVVEFDLDPFGTQVNWHGSRNGMGIFHLQNCYLNADYDMVGASLGVQLKTSMSGIEWDMPGLEKHERDFDMPEQTITWPVVDTEGYYWGGDTVPDFQTEFHVRSNVQAMTRMLHFFKVKRYDRIPSQALNVSGEIVPQFIMRPRSFLTFPECTRWQYQIANQPVPDRAITSQIYVSSFLAAPALIYPRTHFARMFTTTFKTAGEITMAPGCGFTPKSDFLWDYGKKLVGNGVTDPVIATTSAPYQATIGDRGDDGTFFLAYDFTRQTDGPRPPKIPWGEGSLRLRDTEFIVQFGFNNRIPERGITAAVTVVNPGYTLVMVTLVEYKRRLVIDKLGRLDAYF